MSPTIRQKYKYFHPTVGVMSSHDFADIMIFRFRFRAKDRRQKFHFCRLPFDVRARNVKLNLSGSDLLTAERGVGSLIWAI